MGRRPGSRAGPPRGPAAGCSCTVGAVSDSEPLRPRPVPRPAGRLTRDEAVALLIRAGELLAQGDYPAAGDHYLRVVGFDDATITAAALMGLGEVRYRLNDESAAVATWQAVIDLGETPSTYGAWRNIAAARVRDGDLPGALDAYREADRRAPPEDKAEIANRLGWLSKETGNVGASKKYFARGRGDRPLISATVLIIAVTSIVWVTAVYASMDSRCSTCCNSTRQRWRRASTGDSGRSPSCTTPRTRSTSPSTCTRCICRARSSSAGTAPSASSSST